MIPIDEATRRNPEFSEASIPIVLNDGQEWHFPKPWAEIRPRMSLGKPIGLWCHTTHGHEFDLAVEALREAEDNADVIIGVMTIGAFLLRKNYDLKDAELESLFVFRFDSPESTEKSMNMVREISSVAMGTEGPKALSGGGC